MRDYKDLVDVLRHYGLSNGSCIGRHLGLMDEAADAIEDLLNRVVWIVSYYDAGEYPVVTAFNNKETAMKCYDAFLGKHDKVDIDECPVYSSFLAQ